MIRKLMKSSGLVYPTPHACYPELEKLLALPAADRLRLADMLVADLPTGSTDTGTPLQEASDGEWASPNL